MKSMPSEFIYSWKWTDFEFKANYDFEMSVISYCSKMMTQMVTF